MLNIEDFKREFYNQLEKELAPDGITLKPQGFVKVNGIRDGLVIRSPESPIAPVIYYDDIYKDHRILDKPVKDLAREQADHIRNLKGQLPGMPNLTWDKNGLYVCVVNSNQNAELLKNIPHSNVEDLSIIVRYRVGPDASLVVDNQICAEQFKMTSEELLQTARDNTYRQGYCCQSLGSMISGFLKDAGASEDYMYDMQAVGPEREIMVLTNASGVDGAVLGTDPRVMDEIHDTIGGDFYVLPSSRHEMLLVPESLDLDKDFLRDMVQNVNQTVVNERDFLSDNIYQCKGPEMSLTLASKDMELDQEPILEKSLGRSR